MNSYHISAIPLECLSFSKAVFCFPSQFVSSVLSQKLLYDLELTLNGVFSVLFVRRVKQTIWQFVVDCLRDISQLFSVHGFLQENLTPSNDSVEISGSVH